LAPVAPMPETQVQALRAVLRPAAAALAEARPLADMPEGRHAITWTRDGLRTQLPHAQPAPFVAYLLELDAALQAEGGQTGQARASCRGALNAGRSLGDEPICVSQLVRIACAAVAIRRAEWVLGQSVPPEEALANLQGLLEREAGHPALLTMARGERGIIHWTMSAATAGDLPLSDLAHDMGVDDAKKLESLLTPEALRPAHAWLLRHLSRFVEIAKLPAHEQQRQIEPWSEARQAAPDLARFLLVAGP